MEPGTPQSAPKPLHGLYGDNWPKRVQQAKKHAMDYLLARKQSTKRDTAICEVHYILACRAKEAEDRARAVEALKLIATFREEPGQSVQWTDLPENGIARAALTELGEDTE